MNSSHVINSNVFEACPIYIQRLVSMSASWSEWEIAKSGRLKRKGDTAYRHTPCYLSSNGHQHLSQLLPLTRTQIKANGNIHIEITHSAYTPVSAVSFGRSDVCLCQIHKWVKFCQRHWPTSSICVRSHLSRLSTSFGLNEKCTILWEYQSSFAWRRERERERWKWKLRRLKWMRRKSASQTEPPQWE